MRRRISLMKHFGKKAALGMSVLLGTAMFVPFAGCKDDIDLDSDLSPFVQEQREKWYIGQNKKLSWYIGINWWSYTEDWVSYPVLKEVSQITGVVPKTSIAQDNDNTALKLRMANNNLPDLISVGVDSELLEELIEGDYVYSYGELIEKYCKDYVSMDEFKSWCDDSYWNYTAWQSDKSEYDGKIYGLNSFYYPDVSDLGQLTFNVKEDVYKAIGSPDMSTEEGFVAALRKVKEAYPDMYPLSIPESWYYWIFEEAFGVLPYYVTDGGVQMRIKDPKFEKALLFLRQLYEEKLLDPDVFIKADKTTDLAAGKIFCYPVTYWGLDTVNASLGDGKGFVCVEPLRGNDVGDNVRFQGTSRRGWTTTLISKKCADPEAAIKFALYMFSKDGNMLVCYGHENEHYTITEDNKVKRTDDVVKQRAENLTKFEKETGIFTQRLFNYPYYDEAETQDERTQNNVEMSCKYCYDSTVFSYHMSPSSTTRLGGISAKVWAKYNTLWPQMVTAKTEEDAKRALSNAIGEMNALGLADLERYWTEQYAKNIAQFGDPFAE